MCIHYAMRDLQHICAIHHTTRYPEQRYWPWLQPVEPSVFLMFEVSREDVRTAPHLSNATAQSRPSELGWSLASQLGPEWERCWTWTVSWSLSCWLSPPRQHSSWLTARSRNLKKSAANTRVAPIRKSKTSRSCYELQESRKPDRMLSSVIKLNN